jgi:hypothetical protein
MLIQLLNCDKTFMFPSPQKYSLPPPTTPFSFLGKFLFKTWCLLTGRHFFAILKYLCIEERLWTYRQFCHYISCPPHFLLSPPTLLRKPVFSRACNHGSRKRGQCAAEKPVRMHARQTNTKIFEGITTCRLHWTLPNEYDNNLRWTAGVTS